MPFDNSTFSGLADHLNPNAASPTVTDTCRLPPESLQSIIEDSEDLENDTKLSSLHCLGGVNEESQNCRASAPSKFLEELDQSEHNNITNDDRSLSSTILGTSHHDDNDFSSGDCSTVLPDNDIPFGNTSSATATAASSPTKPEVTVVVAPPAKSKLKGSRLPVMKHLRRLSIHTKPATTLTGFTWPHAKVATATAPLVIKKKTRPATQLPPSPTKAAPRDSDAAHGRRSRLPTTFGTTARSRIADSGKMAARRLSRIIS